MERESFLTSFGLRGNYLKKERSRNNIILFGNIIALIVLFASYRKVPSTKFFISQCLFLSSYFINFMYCKFQSKYKLSVLNEIIINIIAIVLFGITFLGSVGYGIISFSSQRILYLGNYCTNIIISGRIISLESIEIICLIIINKYLEYIRSNLTIRSDNG